MKKDNKPSELKKGLATGAGAAIGGVAGSFAGDSAAQHGIFIDVDEPEPEVEVEEQPEEVQEVQEVQEPQAQSTAPQHHHAAATLHTDSQSHQTSTEPEAPDAPANNTAPSGNRLSGQPADIPGDQPVDQPAEQPVDQPAEQHETVTVMDTEVEVLAYQRIDTDAGTMDAATVQDQSGQQVVFIDTDLDSQADLAWVDHNEDSQITDDELYNIEEQNVDMHPMMDAANFSSEYADNEIPDYVNDADIDGYMA